METSAERATSPQAHAGSLPLRIKETHQGYTQASDSEEPRERTGTPSSQSRELLQDGAPGVAAVGEHSEAPQGEHKE